MCGKKCLILVAIILIAIAIPLSITSFVFERSEHNDNGCNLNNVMGHNLNQYLFGINITGIVAIFAIIFLLVSLLCLKEIPVIGKLITVVLVAILGILWIMVALYILFNHGPECVRVGVTYFGYSGILIALAIITFLAVR